MSFQPINDDHAIQSASFVILLSRPVAWSSIEAIMKSPLDWRRDLPATDLTQTFEIQVNPQTGAPQGRGTRGVEFSHKRPDGSASWSLDVLGTEIKVTTTIYTRWKPTWEKAGNILINVAGQLASVEKDKGNTVPGLSLIMTDVFFPDNATPDYSQLLAQTDEIPASVFRRGKFWHSYTGWFDERPSGSILHQLNIEAKSATQETPSIPNEKPHVVIQHNQFYRPRTPMAFDLSTGPLQDAILSEFPVMHDANKQLLRSLLTEQVQDRIKIRD